MTIKKILSIPARIILTAYCFLQFAVQVLWLGKWQMPRVINKNAGNLNTRQDALFITHRHVVRYLATLDFLGLVEFRIEGTPHPRPCILVANHPSLLDFIVFLRDLPNAVCLYKSQTLNNPVLSSFVQTAGYIEGLDGTTLSSKRIVASTCDRLEEGHHVVFFPEGTRSETATSVRKFRSTAFHAAIKSGKPVQPVAIYCQPLFLGKNQPWKDFSRQKNIMTIRYLPVIEAVSTSRDDQSATSFARDTHETISNALTEMSMDNPTDPHTG